MKQLGFINNRIKVQARKNRPAEKFPHCTGAGGATTIFAAARSTPDRTARKLNGDTRRIFRHTPARMGAEKHFTCQRPDMSLKKLIT